MEGMRRKVYPGTPGRAEYFSLPAKTIQAMDYLYTLLKFVIGGSVIVGVTLLARACRSSVRRHTCSSRSFHRAEFCRNWALRTYCNNKPHIH